MAATKVENCKESEEKMRLKIYELITRILSALGVQKRTKRKMILREGTTILNSENVNRIFENALILRTENHVFEIIAQAFSIPAAFRSDRLENHRRAILDMLKQLPDKFNSSGGALLRDAYFTDSGTRWTFSFVEVNRLLTLGVAIGAVIFPTTRESWPERHADVSVALNIG